MTINRIRLSFVSTETILSAEESKVAPLRSITSQFGYASSVDMLQRGERIELGLQLPWPRPSGQHFWERYLHDLTPGQATGKLCFRRLVPLRLPASESKLGMELDLKDRSAKARAELEGFYYPFGTGLIVTVTLSGDFNLAAIGDLAQLIRHSKVFRDLDSDDAPGPAISLGELISAWQNKLREMGYGANATGGVRGAPFSVATVLTGSGYDPAVEVEPQGEVRKFLNGLVAWVPNWKLTPAPPFQDGLNRLRTQSRSATPGDVLAAAKRGRAVWFPLRFRQNKTGAHSMACYHRNLTLASLQTESLLMLVNEVENCFSKAARVPASTQKVGRLAAGLLGRMFAGTDTYRSYSIRAQIQQSDALLQTNKLRERFGMSKLPQVEI